jgi:Ca2+-binding RTX toxin-like protein
MFRALTVVLALLAIAAPADAATVGLTRQGTAAHGAGEILGLELHAAPGEANAVTIEAGPGGVVVRDAGAPLTAGPYCEPLADGVACALPASAVVDLGDGDDRLAVRGVTADVYDGPGDDVLEIATGTFHAGTGADAMRVTESTAASRVSYATRTAGVWVTENGVADDGEAGERDDVGLGIQSVDGGSGDDVLIADPDPHILDGKAGDDRIAGGPRDDILTGDAGDDVLLGGAADDDLLAGPGADVIRGGPGEDATGWPHAGAGVRVALDDRPGDGAPGEDDDAGADVEVVTGTAYDDVMRGSAGPQVLDGREGDDRLDGGGGRDEISGGTGDHNVLTGGPGPDEIASAGIRDAIRTRDGARDAVGCHSPSSSRQRFAVDALDAVRGCATGLRIREGQRSRVRADGRVTLLAHCPADRGTCAGTVRLTRCRSAAPPIGRARFRVPDGHVRRLRVRLARRATCALATARSRRVRPPASAVETTARLTFRG